MVECIVILIKHSYPHSFIVGDILLIENVLSVSLDDNVSVSYCQWTVGMVQMMNQSSTTATR